MRQRQQIESCIDQLKLCLEDESQRCDEKADCLDNLGSLHEM